MPSLFWPAVKINIDWLGCYYVQSSSESCSVFLLHTSGVLVRKNLTVSVNDKMFRFGDILDQISSICYSLFRKGLSCCEPVWISLCPLLSAVVRLYCILYLKSHCVWPRQAAAFSIFSVFYLVKRFKLNRITVLFYPNSEWNQTQNALKASGNLWLLEKVCSPTGWWVVGGIY